MNNSDWSKGADGVWREKRIDPPMRCLGCGLFRAAEHFDHVNDRNCMECWFAQKMLRRVGGGIRRTMMTGSGSARLEKLIGCTGVEFKRWIESHFSEGMNWGNASEWHIDHVRPVCSFTKGHEKDMRDCWHYTNLKPLWATENLSKSGKY